MLAVTQEFQLCTVPKAGFFNKLHIFFFFTPYFQTYAREFLFSFFTFLILFFTFSQQQPSTVQSELYNSMERLSSLKTCTSLVYTRIKILYKSFFFFFFLDQSCTSLYACVRQGFKIRTVYWTVKEKGSRFLRLNRGRTGIEP